MKIEEPSVQPVAPHEMVLTLDGLVDKTGFVALMKQVLKTPGDRLRLPRGRGVHLEGACAARPASRSCFPHSAMPAAEQPGTGPIHRAAGQRVAGGRGLHDQHPDPQRHRRSHPLYCLCRSRSLRPAVAAVERLEIARAIGRLNRVLQDERFILVGPGRWGSSNLDLGVKITYADVFNTKMLVELGYSHGGGLPEVSYGTHFFQDWWRSRIFPLAIFPDQPDSSFDRRFFSEAPNLLSTLLPGEAASEGVLKVVDVSAVRAGRLLEVVMSSDQSRAMGYLRQYD